MDAAEQWLQENDPNYVKPKISPVNIFCDGAHEPQRHPDTHELLEGCHRRLPAIGSDDLIIE